MFKLITLTVLIIILGGCTVALGGKRRVEYKDCNGQIDYAECYGMSEPELLDKVIYCGSGIVAYNVCKINKNMFISEKESGN